MDCLVAEAALPSGSALNPSALFVGNKLLNHIHRGLFIMAEIVGISGPALRQSCEGVMEVMHCGFGHLGLIICIRTSAAIPMIFPRLEEMSPTISPVY